MPRRALMTEAQRDRLLAIPTDEALRFVAGQLAVAPDALADYAARGPTRYEQLGTLRELFGFATLSRSLQAWLFPVYVSPNLRPGNAGAASHQPGRQTNHQIAHAVIS